VTDDSHTPADDAAAPPSAVANDVGAPEARPDLPTFGVQQQEGAPGSGVITLRGLPGAPPGETIELGFAGANNHSPAIGHATSDAGRVSRIGIVWIESPAGDTSGIGAVMLQRLSVDAGVHSIDWAALAAAANDNVTQVTDLSGIGAIGSSPTVAELATGGACVAWIGSDGQVHGRLYPPAHVDAGVPDDPAYAAINAALDDLGPVGEAPDGARRLQVSELRPGTLAVMWLALAQGGTVLRGNLFVAPADTNLDSHEQGWTQHAIPDARLPHDFAGPFSVALAGHDVDAGLEVSCPGASGTVALTLLDRGCAGSARSMLQAAASDLPAGPSALGAARKAAGAPAAPDDYATADPDAPSHGSRSEPAPRSAGEESPAGIVLTAAATPGQNEMAPNVASVGEGFAVAWQEPGVTDQVRQLKVGLYDAHGAQMGPEILVADDAVAGDEMADISALEDGLVAVYVDASEDALVVKAYGSDGAQIGQEAIVARGDAGAIVETALAANAADELAVVYRQQHGDADSGEAGYGSIMLQRYCLATVDGAAGLVELGGDGDTSALELAAGRAPEVIGAGGGFVIAWVESNGARETVKGVILDRDGAEVQRIDLSDLLGDAGVAEGAEPTLLDAGGGSFLLSWLQPDNDGGQVLMAALYRETAPGIWLAPDAAIPLKAFAETPHDYAVSVSPGADGPVINVIWEEDRSGPGGHKAVYSQSYDLDGGQLGDPTRIARGDAGNHGPPDEGGSLAAAALGDGQVVIVAHQGSEGDQDLFAHLIVTPADDESDGSGHPGQSDTDGSRTFITRVGEETAINPLADALGSGLGISHINGVPITTASPVDVGFGWVQLREDGWLTVTPDAGYKGRIEFDYVVAGMADGQGENGQVVVDVGADAAPAVVMLRNQVTAVAEDVSTASALKVADIAMTDGELGTDGLSLTGLDASMFEIVGSALYLKEGIALDFETKPTLSVEILAIHADGPDDGASFTLSVAGAGAAALAAASDLLVFAPGYGGTAVEHPLVDLSSIRHGIFQELMDAAALTQDGDNVVITLNPDDPGDLQKIVLKGAALASLGDVDFKYS